MPKDLAYDLRSQFYDLEFDDISDRGIFETLSIDQHTHVLDIPCGTGRHFNYWAKKNCKVTFADICLEMVSNVERKIGGKTNNMNVCVGNMINIDQIGKFDLIAITREAFQFLSPNEIRTAIFNIGKALNNNGI